MRTGRRGSGRGTRGIRRLGPFGPLGVLLATTAALAGCGDGPPARATIPPDASGALASAAATATAPATAPANPTPGGSAGGSPGASAPASGEAAVTVDPTLLAILPATVAGLAVSPVPDPTGLTDPALVASVDRIAQAFVVDPASGDFAYVSIVVLRPGVFGDAFFRSWRDSFDEGACSQAGGVAGHAEAQIGGRTAYIGRCDGGVLTYHVRLEGRDAIVSVSSLGETHLGEQLLAGLNP